MSEGGREEEREAGREGGRERERERPFGQVRGSGPEQASKRLEPAGRAEQRDVILVLQRKRKPMAGP